jgi:hypothetical protein
VLAAVAAFGWLIPIATIYPPGALIVGLEVSTIARSFNVSIFHQKSLCDMGKLESIADIVCREQDGDYNEQWIVPHFPEAAQNLSLLRNCTINPQRLVNVLLATFSQSNSISRVKVGADRLDYIAGESLVSGEIARLHHPGGTNSSYALSIWGMILECETKNRTSLTSLRSADLDRSEDISFDWENIFPVFNSTLRSNFAIDRASQGPRTSPNTTRLQDATITLRFPQKGKEDKYNYFPCLRNGSQSIIQLVVPIVETVCRPKVARYNVRVSYAGNIQDVSYSLAVNSSSPGYDTNYNGFNGSFEQFVHLSDAATMYDRFAALFNQADDIRKDMRFATPNYKESSTPYKLDNGTIVDTCLLEWGASITGHSEKEWSSLWGLSVFEQRLHKNYDERPSFDPKIANELLINITISALSLNERFDMVNGTESQTFNIYHFQNKLIFFLPYGLCLGLSIPILVLGLIALHVHNNGVSAITGGFVQILMTTTGRTEIEAAILKGSATLGGHENVTKELEDLEIRFGELVNDENVREESAAAGAVSNGGSTGVGSEADAQEDVESANVQEGVMPVPRAGFGTAQDIKPLRKRVKTSKA